MIALGLKRILLIINYLAATALLLSVLSGFIPPAKVPLLSLFGQAFPYFLFVNIFFVLAWGIARKKYFIISLLVLLMSTPVIFDTIQLFPAKRKINCSENIKVLTYNVRVFDLYNWSKNKITRNKIFELIRTESPDIACFQEYFNSSHADFAVHDSLFKNQRFKYAHLHFNVKLKNGHNFGIATYSNFPIIRRHEIIFEDSKNLAIATDLKIGNDTIRVINCHLESVRFLAEDYHFMDSLPALNEDRVRRGVMGITKRLAKASIKRSKQADIIYQEIVKAPYKVFLCGDFNDTPSSYTYQKFKEILNDSHRYQTLGFGGTYPRFFPNLRIDYILYNNTISCLNFKSIKVDYSDHYPLVGEYCLE